MNKIFGISTTTILVTLCLAGCAPERTVNNEEDGRIQVYTSFYAMYDFASEIGGDKIDVYNVCPPGTEVHDYEPTASEMAEITSADVFIYNGMGMEHWTDSVTEILQGKDVLIVNTSSNIPNVYENSDPHVWLDPENAYAQMEAIADAFIEVDGGNSDYYKSRLDSCKDKIDKLDKDFTDTVSGLSQKTIITSHAAYGNLCDAYGLTQYAVNGTDNSGDPTPARMSEIENYIKENNIKYIFTEPLSSSKVMQTLADDTGCEILTLNPFEGGTDKGYFDVMTENLEAIKMGLQ